MIPKGSFIKIPMLVAMFAQPTNAEVIIDALNGNGGFVSASTAFNGSPNQWTAQRGVWLMEAGSSLATAPFGTDTAANSRAIQVHNDAGETLTSTVNFSVQAGDTVTLNFDYKTGGSGNNTTLTASLWDASTNTSFATFGSVGTSSAQTTFLQRTFSITATEPSSTLRLRFTLPSAGGVGKDVHIDRIHLEGGQVVPPPPPAPIVYATRQPLVEGDTPERIVEKAAKTLPRANQVIWQRMEHTYFIHFGVNTFRSVEWGTGYESPALFNPTALDASQWVREIKQAGGKQVLLVAKHHDGFCLWPSRYTAQDVASSPWLGGAGDVVRAVSEACQAQGIKFGVYVSPADLYQIHADETPGNPEGYYGNGSSIRASTIPTDPATFKTNPASGRAPAGAFGSHTYQVNDYNRYFLNQLYELLTEYGPVHQIWFDGANPEPGISETHDYTKWYDLIRKLRPDIVIGIGGADARWSGNEYGAARTTEWSVVPFTGDPAAAGTGPDPTGADLGSRSKLTIGTTLSWFPAEADVPILNGWFWNPSKTPKSVSSLLDIYYSSVGRNANLLLNLSPDTRGLIPDNQLNSLRPFGQIVRNTFATNLASGAAVTAPADSQRPATNLLDADPDSFWESAETATTAELILDLPATRTFDVVSLQEPIASRSQRIEAFSVDVWNGSSWSTQATATTVGHKRLLKLASPVTTSRVRVRITASRLNPSLAEVGLFKEAISIAAPTIANRDTQGQVAITGPAGLAIRYTLDGSEPGPSSIIYTGPIPLPLGGTVRAVAIGGDGLPGIEASRAFPGIASTGWTADADQETQAAALAIDGDPATSWSATGPATPHWLRIDMGSPRWISGFTYLPPAGGGAGTVTSYRFETSDNGLDWITRSEGTFGNMANNPVRQDVTFEAIKTRWFRLTVLGDVSFGTSAKAAEVSVIAAGFDAWKRDRGQSSVQPQDVLENGRTALAEYVFGSHGGVLSASHMAAGHLAVLIRRRAELPDVSSAIEISHDLANWSTPAASSILEASTSGEWEDTRWSVEFPISWPAGFARGAMGHR